MWPSSAATPAGGAFTARTIAPPFPQRRLAGNNRETKVTMVALDAPKDRGTAGSVQSDIQGRERPEHYPRAMERLLERLKFGQRPGIHLLIPWAASTARPCGVISTNWPGLKGSSPDLRHPHPMTVLAE